MRNSPNPGLGLAILRVVIGVIFVAHGWTKLFGGMEGTIGFFGSLGIPAPTLAAWFVALLETGGGALLIVGLMVTPIALLLAVQMVVAIVLVHIPNGFFVIGPGTGGYSFSLLVAAGLVALVLAGPGNWTLANRMQKDVLEA
ncbi:MAG: DoxX family protein [Gemmatimonadota bacterium]|nr:DoxX family protein [Gemmatimonadota bacterium]